MSVIQVENLSVAFRPAPGQPGGTVLDEVTLALEPGQTLGLVGESGSGKSLLCAALLGLLPKGADITGGRILFTDPAHPDATTDLTRITEPRMREIRGRKIAMIFQEPMTAFSPVHTIGGQISEICRQHQGCDRLEAQERTVDMLARVGLPDPAGAARCHAFELSGGMRQRAMIAMALICKPAVLMADEPTTALDVTTQAGILKLMAELQDSLGMAILLVTHDLGVVASLAQNLAVLHRGRVMERGPAPSVLRAPRHPYSRMLIDAVPKIGAPAPLPLPPNAPPILKVRDLSVCYPPRHVDLFARAVDKNQKMGSALDAISFEIKRAECLGVVGESGCGKSTLARAIMGAVPPSSGEITFCAEDADGVAPAQLTGRALKSFRRQVHYVFQDAASALNPRHTLADILREPLLIHGMARGAELDARIADVMDLVGLPRQCAARFPHAFSGGQRQRIGIARALMTKPDLILLDEPTSALDVSVQAQILDLLGDLQARLGLTYLFISHNLAVIDVVADRIAVMCRGRIVEMAPRNTLFSDPRHPYTRTLLSVVPDVEHPLDLSAVTLEADDPACWPEPFRLGPDTSPSLVEISPDHWVLFAQRPNSHDE